MLPLAKINFLRICNAYRNPSEGDNYVIVS